MIKSSDRIFIISDWSEFKKYIDGTYYELSFIFNEKATLYDLWTESYGGWVFNHQILFSNTSDKNDFENNFKNLAPRNTGGANSNFLYDGYGNPLNSANGKLETTAEISSIALPTNAATESTQATLLTEAEFQSLIGEVQSTPTSNTLLDRVKSINDSITSRLGSLGQKTMANSSPVTIASDQSTIPVELQSGGAPQGVKIEDGSGSGREAYVDVSNRLLVAIAPPSPPPATTEVLEVAQSNLNGTANLVYTIPTGENLVVQNFRGGAEGGGKSSKVELFYDPNGNGSGMTLISVGYVGDTNFNFNVNYTVPDPGNGTRAIRLRRVRLDGGGREVFGSWQGYY